MLSKNKTIFQPHCSTFSNNKNALFSCLLCVDMIFGSRISWIQSCSSLESSKVQISFPLCVKRKKAFLEVFKNQILSELY